MLSLASLRLDVWITGHLSFIPPIANCAYLRPTRSCHTFLTNACTLCPRGLSGLRSADLTGLTILTLIYVTKEGYTYTILVYFFHFLYRKTDTSITYFCSSGCIYTYVYRLILYVHVESEQWPELERSRGKDIHSF